MRTAWLTSLVLSGAHKFCSWLTKIQFVQIPFEDSLTPCISFSSSSLTQETHPLLGTKS